MLNQTAQALLRPVAMTFGALFFDRSLAADASEGGLDNYGRAVRNKCRDCGFTACHFSRDMLRQMLTNEPAGVWKFDSPERDTSRDSLAIGFESERGILRHQRFRLLCDRALSDRAAYDEFVQKQPPKLKLNFDSFLELRKEVGMLSADERSVLEVTAVLKPSQEAIKKHAALGFELPADSEEMLTAMTRLAYEKGLNVMPAVKSLTRDQRALLQSAYPFHFHMRHLIFGEAGLKELDEALESVSDFRIAKWRWIIDLCGFDRPQYGLTQPLWERAQFVFSLLERARVGNIDSSEIIPCYFMFLKKQFHLDSHKAFNAFSKNAQMMMTLLIAFCENPSQTQINAVIQAYTRFENEHGNAASDAFVAFLSNAKANSPTYLPAILKTAQSQFSKFGYDEFTSGELAARYTFSVLESVYAHIRENPAITICARDAAWYQNWGHHDWANAFLDNKLNFSVSVLGELQTTVAKLGLGLTP